MKVLDLMVEKQMKLDQFGAKLITYPLLMDLLFLQEEKLNR